VGGWQFTGNREQVLFVGATAVKDDNHTIGWLRGRRVGVLEGEVGVGHGCWLAAARLERPETAHVAGIDWARCLVFVEAPEASGLIPQTRKYRQ
jgi:hypothetical protein